MFGQRQRAHHLREVRVRGGADEQAARKATLLVAVCAEPGTRTPTRPERLHIELGRLGHGPRLAALAPHHEVGEVAAGAALVEPQLPPARILRAMDVPVPVEV